MLILPTPKDEAWKYTNLGPLAKLDFAEAAAPAAPQVPEGVLGVDGPHFVLVNGAPDADLTPANDLPDGVTVHKDGGPRAGSDLPLVDMNAKAGSGGFHIHVAEGVRLDKPLHLIYVTQAEAAPLLVLPYLLITLGAGASATVLESHVGVGGETVFSNMTTQAQVAEGATLRHYRLQNEALTNSHVSTALVEVAAGGLYDAFCFARGAALSRNEVRVTLNGEGAEARLNGAYVGRGTQHQDITTFVDHAMPGGNSSQVVKGVLDDKARGVFQGKVLVRKDAQHTDGRQMHKALLLSDKAEVDCKPELEIYADDVKCAHGATVGELDDEQLFYLQSRGIAEEEARRLLIDAFLHEAIDLIEDEDARDAFREALA